jgi:flagellar biogenesis protein FliO
MTGRCRSAAKRLTVAGLGSLILATSALASADEPVNIGPGLEPGSEHLVPDQGTPLSLRQDAAPLQPSAETSDSKLGYGALLLLIIGGAGFLGYRRLRVAKGALPPGRVEVLSRTALGARTSVVLLRVEGRKVLVGVSPGGMTALERWRVGDADVVPFEDEDEADELDEVDELEDLEAPASNRGVEREEDAEAFQSALGQVEQRLARYQATTSEPAPRSAATPSINPRPAIQGGQQAASLARLRRIG